MKVILKREVDNLGLPGDVVDVADGYGRNYLIPRGMAILATRGAMKDAEAITRSRKAAEAKTLGTAEAMREVLEERALRITARVDERGALYGSVSSVDIERVLRERGHDIPRKRIELKGTIKEIGTYEIPVRVHPQVAASVTVEVVDVEGKVGVAGAVVDEEPPPLVGANEDALVEQALEAAEAYEAEHADVEDADEATDTSASGGAEETNATTVS
ncbi:MAG: 50S ribosomal protein L9 [Nitriliruptoraceae bacterium]